MIKETLDNTEEKSVFLDTDSDYGKKIKTIPKKEKEIGVDRNNVFLDNIINAGINGQLDMSKLESFTQASQNRNILYDLLDTMCEDSTIAAVLETYAEDATEYNDKGQIVWCESSNPDVSKYVTFLLDTMNVDKNIYKWVHSLCKYGDVYLRLFRASEYEDHLLDNEKDDNKDDYYNSLGRDGKKNLNESVEDKEKLEEDVKIVAYKTDDNYAMYVEMCPNPAEIFELTKFGKTYGYVYAESYSMHKVDNIQLPYYQVYNFNKKDVEIYDPKTFVHACLEDNTSRTPEKINIFINEEDNTDANTETGNAYSYIVKRGQSLLYNVFKIWRELMLLENSILLNRISKSSITRVIGVEVGDMPKENVGPHLQGIKQLVEQKSAINVGKSMSEYTDPGPIENNIYVPTHNGIGALTTSQIGGDVDVKSLADLDYFKNKFFGGLRVPKQFFGDTDDSAGFNGGESLSLISSRYAKMVKRIQNTMCQAITDIVNLMLIDRGLDSYVNNFSIRMQNPTTSEEKDRRENLSNKIAVVSDIMNLLTDIEDVPAKLKILKSLLSNVLTDDEVITVLSEEIEKLEGMEEEVDMDIDDENIDLDSDGSFSIGGIDGGSDLDVPDLGTEEEPTEDSGEDLPSPEDLGVDMTDSSNPDFS